MKKKRNMIDIIVPLLLALLSIWLFGPEIGIILIILVGGIVGMGRIMFSRPEDVENDEPPI